MNVDKLLDGLKIKELSLLYNLHIAGGGRRNGLIPFSRVSILSEIQTASSRI